MMSLLCNMKWPDHIETTYSRPVHCTDLCFEPSGKKKHGINNTYVFNFRNYSILSCEMDGCWAPQFLSSQAGISGLWAVIFAILTERRQGKLHTERDETAALSIKQHVFISNGNQSRLKDRRVVMRFVLQHPADRLSVLLSIISGCVELQLIFSIIFVRLLY